MICPNKGNKDFDIDDCIGCEYYDQCLAHSGLNMDNQGDNFPNINKPNEKDMNNLPSFIQNGICKKDNMTYCNLGYACDGCPYNPDNQKKDMDKVKNQIPITKEEIVKFKEDLDNIIYFNELGDI